jgi:O-antigen ligase/tetratricopeptide (TPR) repeat protein
LAVLAPALGGSTQLWAQAALLLALAILLIVAPPRRSPGPIWITLFLAIGALSLTAFLPAQWLPVPAWRQHLNAKHEVSLPDTASPQPWLSAEAACLLFGGIILATYLLTQTWDDKSRRRALTIYAIGVLVIATAALVSHFTHHKVPFWPQTLNSSTNFGFFPNRNQTANVLALAGIVATALAYEAFERRPRTGWAWLAALIVIGTALVINYSRAGIILFALGIVGWILVAFAFSTSRKSLSLGLAGVAVLLALFFLFGGETLHRFQLQVRAPASDFRIPIQADALRLSTTAPWFGQGLGNFEPVFALHRSASAAPNRALHPESDWLWFAVEMGWPATLLLLAAFLLWLKACFPFSAGSDRPLRSAALFCGLTFALHSLIDVSGHRLGAAWPALFLASLALHPDRRLVPRPWVASAFRILGGLLIAISAWWFASLFSESVRHAAPTSPVLASLVQRIERQSSQGEFAQALETADSALRIAPLDWRIYYQRGVARLGTDSLPWVSARDFLTARHLEPRWAESCFGEGRLWLSIGQPELAIDAWTEALRRSGRDALSLYTQMLAATRSEFKVRHALEDMARHDRDYLLAFLQFAGRLECELEIGHLLDTDPTLQSLSFDQRQTLFVVWFERGDRELLFTRLRENPAWLAAGWPWLVRGYAQGGQFDQAYQLARQFSAPPPLPTVSPRQPLPDLEEQFRIHPDNFQDGLELYSAQRDAGKISEAVATLVALQAIPGHPAYLSFLEAGLRADLQQWEDAWNAWHRYAGNDFR